MGDHFKQVQSGDLLKIPAATFNAFVYAARYVRAHGHVDPIACDGRLSLNAS